MSYSDEPNVVSEQKRSKKIYLVTGGFVLFFGLLAAVAFFPRIMDYQRRNTPTGPNQGNVYFVKLEGERYSMELVRSEPHDFHLHVFLLPVRERTVWQPEDYHVTVGIEGEGEERLEWDAETGSFGPSEARFHPMGEFRFGLSIEREDETLWSGRRWSFAENSGHAH